MRSQIEPDRALRCAVAHIHAPIGHNELVEMRDIIFRHLERRGVNCHNEDHERSIRWKRSAKQIWRDGYTYIGRDCTDLVTVFQALCCVFNLSTRIVRVCDGPMFHSIAEVRLTDGCWRVFDVAKSDSVPENEYPPSRKAYGRWSFIKRGRTAWSLNLDRDGSHGNDVTPTPVPL